MLILTRKSDESVIVANNIEVKILSIRGDQVRIGFSAPKEVTIYRKEVHEVIQHENRQAVTRGERAITNLASSLTRQLQHAERTDGKPTEPAPTGRTASNQQSKEECL